MKDISTAAEQSSANAAAQTELCERVKRFLALQHYPRMRRLKVTVSGGIIVLDGSVSSFHERQMAVVFCKRVAGVHKVIDRLIVSETSLDGQRGHRGERGRVTAKESENNHASS